MFASESYLTRSGTPVIPVDLGRHDIIGFDGALARSPGAAWLDEHHEEARLVLRCNSTTSALNASVAGMGVAVLPCFLADVEPGLRRLTDEIVASRPIWVVFHPDVAKIKRVRTVIDFLSTIISRDAALFRGERADQG